MASDLKYRYPGLRPFRVDDRDVFYGREQEARELTDLIRTERTVILFSKSGLGKSSLLNARVCPQLTADGFWPILIRFQPQIENGNTDNTLFNPAGVVIERLRTEFDAAYQQLAKKISGWKTELTALPEPVASAADEAPAESVRRAQLQSDIRQGEQQLANAVPNGNTYVPAQSILFNAEQPQLWEYVKIYRFPNDAVPIFVFDQFEEFFAFPIGSQQLFGQQLAELIHDQPPTRIINWLLDIPPFKRQPQTMVWGKQPSVKCLLSIRSDRLFEIDGLKAFIPLIFRNRYRLNPLHDDQAREAIDKPAQTDGVYRTPKFSFSPAVREKIIGDLSNKDCEIESSQLQIVCNHFESYVVEKWPTPDVAIVIDKIDSANSTKRILNRFYRNQLRSLGTTEEIELARHVLENELVVNHQRVGLAESRMQELLDGHTEVIEKLQEARLIRAEETHLGKTYELSHDTLIEPVEKVRQLFDTIRQRENRERERVRERETQLEQQKKAEVERQRLLAEQRRLEQERQEKDIQLLEEQHQRRKLKRLTTWLVVTVGAVVGMGCLTFFSLTNNKRLLADANSEWAADEYTAGNQRMAYRLWESSQQIRPLWDFGKKNGLSRQIRNRLLVPFAGKDTQINPGDTSLHYVANLYQGNYFEVWEKSETDANRLGTYQKLDWPEQDPLNLKNATQLQLRASTLVVFDTDSTLQVLDLEKQKRIFPRQGGSYTFPSLHKLLSKGLVIKGSSGSVRAVRTVFISPGGRWLAVLGASGEAVHLYNLEKNGEEYTGFRKLAQTIPGFSLDDIDFSASEEFVLVKYPAKNQCYLLDVRPGRQDFYSSTVYAAFSPSGKYLVRLSETGQLAVRALKTAQRELTVALPPTRENIPELVFNRDESTIIAAAKQAADIPNAYTLYAVQLAKPASEPTVIARNVSDYTLFGWAGHVLYRTGAPASAYNYDLAAATRQPVPWTDYSILKAGKSSALVRTADSGNPTLYVYDVLRGQQRELPLPPPNKASQYAFYASPSGPDEKLIRATAEKLTLYDLTQARLSETCVYSDQCEKPFQTTFLPNTLAVTGPLIKVSNNDGVVLSFFAQTAKNQYTYINEHVYPVLTDNDRIAAGL